MRRLVQLLAVGASMLLVLFFCRSRPAAPEAVFTSEPLQLTRFGQIALLRPAASDPPVVIYLSGTPESERRAAALAAHGAFVALVQAGEYLQQANADDTDCHSIAGEFERLSQVVQNNARLEHLSKPLLIGDGVGAALTYAVLAEASKGFVGGVSYGFCPTLPFAKPLCEGEHPAAESAGHELRLKPGPGPGEPWVFTTGAVCEFAVDAFRTGMAPSFETDPRQIECDNLRCPLLSRFFPSFRAEHDAEIQSEDTAKFPLIDLPARHMEKDFFVLLLSGDGGWASIDKALGEYLQNNGVDVVGFDSLDYFWKEKSPQEFSRTIETVLRRYQQRWNRKKFVLAGYSLGADVLPFALRLLPEDLKADAQAVVLLNPSKRTAFEVHFTDWLDVGEDEEGEEVLPQLELDRPPRIACLYGDDEDDSLCRILPKDKVAVVELPGSHHFDGDYEGLAAAIFKALKIDFIPGES
jgi:type IV secretory pathway VirJ component